MHISTQELRLGLCMHTGGHGFWFRFVSVPAFMTCPLECSDCLLIFTTVQLMTCISHVITKCNHTLTYYVLKLYKSQLALLCLCSIR